MEEVAKMNVEEMKKFIETRKENEQEYFTALQNSLIDDMEYMINRWKQGRFYETDAQNLSNSLYKLVSVHKDVEAVDNQLEILDNITKE